MTELSPQAQAVLAAAINDTADIINKPHCDWIQGYSRQIAAALRAAADQVVPGDGSRRANEIRSEFLAIADELENQ